MEPERVAEDLGLDVPLRSDVPAAREEGRADRREGGGVRRHDIHHWRKESGARRYFSPPGEILVSNSRNLGSY